MSAGGEECRRFGDGKKRYRCKSFAHALRKSSGKPVARRGVTPPSTARRRLANYIIKGGWYFFLHPISVAAHQPGAGRGFRENDFGTAGATGRDHSGDSRI